MAGCRSALPAQRLQSVVGMWTKAYGKITKLGRDLVGRFGWLRRNRRVWSILARINWRRSLWRLAQRCSGAAAQNLSGGYAATICDRKRQQRPGGRDASS